MGEPKVDSTEMSPAFLDSFLEKLARHVQVALPHRHPDGYLSLEDASRFLGGMPEETLSAKARAKEIKSYKVGKHRVFDPKDLREYVKRRADVK